MASTSDDISSIALSCGFSSHSHLSTTFAMAFGTSPRADIGRLSDNDQDQ
ncbi:MAG: helix-turn-helix domain-containing protein [Rhodoplanes sp.]